jgi:lipopolysaccharide transport protein LptA
MNSILPILLLAACSASGLNAQTNALAITSQNIDISAKEGEFDLRARVAVYRHDVRVEAEGMRLSCEVLIARLPATGNRIESFIGETNVVIDLVDDKDQTIHGTGNRLVYTYSVTGTATNELVELSGNPALDTPQGTLSGDVITLDRLNNKLKAVTPRMLLRPDTTSKTNAVEATNAPSSGQIPPP